MSPNFRTRLRNKDPLYGTLVTLSAPEATEILAQLGFDWLFIDCEHASFEAHQAQALLQAAGDRCPCLIRVPAGDEIWIKKALDIGAQGIIVPQVNSAEQAQRVVRASKYSPEGTRGVGIGRAHGYGLAFQDYLERANEETAVIIQAESADAIDNIDAIVSVQGVDAVLVGPYDLSASLGQIGKVDHPDVQAAIKTIADACKAVDVALGIFGVTETAVKPYVAQGFNLIAVGVDVLFLQFAAKTALAKLKGE